MSHIWSTWNGFSNWVLVAVVLLGGFGYVRRAVHSHPPATGDRDVAEVLDTLADPHTRKLATVVVDLNAGSPQPFRTAFIGHYVKEYVDD